MSSTLIHIFDSVQLGIMILSLIVSLKLVNNKNIPKYMVGFFLYPLVAVIVFSTSFFATLISKSFYQNVLILNNLSLIFHFSFLSFFIIRAMSEGKNNNYFNLIFGIFITLIFVLLKLFFNLL